ncbi:MAG: ABC transporter substrate-binding protein [Candidatus ainarchaeum sp.]|nr:ABC transporter substrate-binding protein [Candidatus ainarchaeum sp.]
MGQLSEFVSENRPYAAAALVLLVAAGAWLALPALSGGGGKEVVRVGYFPNIQHAQALVGLSRGDFQRELGDGVEISAKVFNAGPSAIEAMFAGEVDIVYIGPNPAITGYIRSEGDALRVVSGACSGGAAFVVRNDSGISSPAGLSGKRLASPQLGNTQDVALRIYVQRAGLSTTDKGGTVEIIPTANPDILTLFARGDIQGAWVPEPWGARLVREGNGTVFVDERDLWPGGKFVTANIIVRRRFLEEHPDLVRKWLKVHVEETQWINAHPGEAKPLLNSEIRALTGKEIRADELDDAFSRLSITYDPVKSSLFESARAAFELGFLGETEPDLSGIYDLSILNGVLREKGLNESY